MDYLGGPMQSQSCYKKDSGGSESETRPRNENRGRKGDVMWDKDPRNVDSLQKLEMARN